MTDPAPHSRPGLELLSGDQRFQLLINAVKDYAIYLLDPAGHVCSWNTGAQHFKGYSAKEILGQHFSRFYTEEDRAAGLPERALQIAAREGRFEAEGWRVRKDGSRFWTSVVIDPVITENGELIGFAKVTRDITERRKAQQEIDKAREALAQAQKMEAVGRLTGGVAHDFNNLLTVIRSSVDLLRMPGLSDEKRARYIDAIAETADRATLLTTQLLAFTRRQPLRPELFDVAARIRGLEHIISTTIGSTIKMEVDVADDIGWVEADPTQFDTAILNMVINARDAMPGGGELKIRARNADGVPDVRSHAPAKGAFLAVSVEDDGIGMDAETLKRIFEPFFTTKEINKGTGLGLSQVYGFAKQSGGEIDAASHLGKGTTFTLYLPRSSKQGAASSSAESQSPIAEPGQPASASILLVEDNGMVGQFAFGLLTELGQSVTWATSAQDALEILDARRQEFNLVFSDVVMPGLNGIDLGLEIRRRWPDLPVVLTSGYSHVIAREGSHGFELLQKPYSLEGLLAVLLGRLSEKRDRTA
ncbi:hybrid sensor histidine kinase/response regulator [Sphingomonas oleivorans]|uniref:histidine kinase n=1 Tax=Sphingomonas oleivorans TaxID=1735121 RepID=A0A2T5FVR9_9SPHN|nr:PAS domain-containing sensor histidine kinase [Sphingomonas oleivorans]PTQ09876.1 hybrid sensor histidine kinase/response regulator [Sphingomonas oleivorans]